MSRQQAQAGLETILDHWKELIHGLTPEEITIFGFTLKRKQYLLISCFALIVLVIVGFKLNKRTIRKEIESYMRIEE